MKPYYNQSAEDVQKQINGGMEPLSDSKVKENQEKYGFNELVEGKKKSTLQIFLEQFKDFLVIILICSAVVSLFLGEAEVQPLSCSYHYECNFRNCSDD